MQDTKSKDRDIFTVSSVQFYIKIIIKATEKG